jgi:hypothetical protein
VVLFHQGDLRALLKLSSAEHLETARRLTNLFSEPKPVEHIGESLEGLIHRTTRGELVRSKSEVIIANLLHSLGNAYAYEQPFTGRDDSVRAQGVLPEDKGEGDAGILVSTTEENGIDSAGIEHKLRALLGL